MSLQSCSCISLYPPLHDAPTTIIPREREREREGIGENERACGDRTRTRRHIMYIDPTGPSSAVASQQCGDGVKGHTAKSPPEHGVIRVEHVLAPRRLSGTSISKLYLSLKPTNVLPGLLRCIFLGCVYARAPP